MVGNSSKEREASWEVLFACLLVCFNLDRIKSGLALSCQDMGKATVQCNQSGAQTSLTAITS